MKNLITEKQNNEISRILEIMKIDKFVISEGRIGREVAEKLWRELEKLKTVLRREYTKVTDGQWKTIFSALEKDNIHNLQPAFQQELARVVRKYKPDFIPEIYKNVIYTWLKDNPGENYKGFITTLKDAQNVNGTTIENLLTTGFKGKAIIQDPNGKPDFFNIELLASRLQSEIDSLKKGKLEYTVESPPRQPWRERKANELDKSVFGKYNSTRAFYEGMLRNEPGSTYFRNWIKTKIKNVLLRLKGKPLLPELSPEERKVALNWFVTGVADWSQVKRVGRTMGWYNMPVNILGQLFKKWLFLSLMFTVFSVGKALLEGLGAIGDKGERMSLPKGFVKRVVGEIEWANLGITSPLVRIADALFFNLVVPLIEGGDAFSMDRLKKYFDGELSRLDILRGRVEKGENVQDETLQNVVDTIPTFDTTGIPMPNPRQDSGRNIPLVGDTINQRPSADSNVVSSDWEQKQ